MTPNTQICDRLGTTHLCLEAIAGLVFGIILVGAFFYVFYREWRFEKHMTPPNNPDDTDDPPTPSLEDVDRVDREKVDRLAEHIGQDIRDRANQLHETVTRDYDGPLSWVRENREEVTEAMALVLFFLSDSTGRVAMAVRDNPQDRDTMALLQWAENEAVDSAHQTLAATAWFLASAEIQDDMLEGHRQHHDNGGP